MTAILSKAQRKAAQAGDWATVRALAKPAKRIERKSWLKSGGKPVKPRNEKATAKRQARYKKAISSPHWKALRKQVLEEQGGLCICGQEPMTTLDHINSYMRLGKELREDVRGLGDRCNAIETTSKRANWANGRRGR